MIRLVALDQTTNTQTTLELEGSPSISLNLAVAKPGETMQRHAPYSQTFRLPFTNTNNQFFAHFYEVTLSDGDFDPTQKTEVELSEDGVPVMRGSMQLRAVRLMAEVYEVNVLSDVGDLFAEMGSKVVRDAFKSTPSAYITSYNYVNSAANVITSQNLANNICLNPAAMPAGTVVVPLADHGLRADQQPVVAQSGYGLMDSAAVEAALSADMLKPAIRLHEVVERIIVSNGFYYESTFLDAAYFQSIYMTLANETPRAPASAANQMKAVCQFGSNLFDDGDEDQWNTVPIDSVTQYGGFDTGSNFNTSTNTYTTAQAGTHHFEGKIRFTLVNAGAGESVDLIGRVSRDGMSIGSTTGTLTTDDNDITLSWSAVAPCAAGQAIKLEFYFEEGQLQSGTDIQVVGQGITADQFAFTHLMVTFAPGGTVDVPASMPRVTQKNFIKDLCQRFNLVIQGSPDDPKKLLIEPYADWIATGVDTYWTDKLDMDKERTLSPTSALKSSVIRFADKESGDVGNAFMESSLGHVFGEYLQNIDDDFATGELKNSPVFSSFFVYSVPTLAGDPTTDLSNVLIHRSYEFDGQGVKPKSQPPKLFHAIGLKDTIETLYVGGSSLTQYLFCSMYEDAPAQDDSRHLFWNNTDRVFESNHSLIHGFPPGIGGYHATYWSAYLADIYNPDARVFEAHFYLTPSDIRSLRFNDRYHILGAAYKLTEVSGYEIGTGESTRCKFLRDIGRLNTGGCDNVPVQSNVNGTVTFQDASGATVADPGVICCEAYGYFYDATTNTCRWQNPDADEGPPAPPYPPTDSSNPLPNYNGDTPGPIAPTGVRTVSQDTAGHSGVTDLFVLMGQTTDATATALTTPSGTSISVDGNTLASGVVSLSSVTAQTSGRFTSRFETFRFLANGHAGTVSISATSGTRLDSGTPGTERRLTAAISNGVLTISASGEASTVIQWTAQVQMVRIYTFD